MKMYSLRKKRMRFSQVSSSSIEHYDATESICLRKFIVATGLLNNVWQSWNNFWRAYWIVHIVGGQDFQHNKILPLIPGLSEPEALYHLLTLIGKKKRGSSGIIVSSRQEATWGDIRIIQDLAVHLSNPTINNVSNVLNAASLFGTTIEHVQTIRNAQIHLSASNMNDLSLVIPYYVISSRPKYPHDIIDSREINSGKVALKAWVENMNNFLAYL